MDHLKRVENDDLPDITMAYSSDESVKRLTKVDTGPVSNEALMSEANKVAKQNLLNSSDTDAGKRFIVRLVIISFSDPIMVSSYACNLGTSSLDCRSFDEYVNRFFS